jgi:hypothetical protein
MRRHAICAIVPFVRVTMSSNTSVVSMYIIFARFEVFMVVTMKNAIWDVTPCDSCKNRRFGETSASIIRVTRIGELGC